MTYDTTFSKVTSIVNALGQKWSFTYDSNGNLVASADPLNHATHITYNVFGEIASITDPMGNATAFSYDRGNPTSVTDASSHTTKYIYDDAGRLTNSMDALGRMASYAYDAQDKLVTVVDPTGGRISRTYDPNGNLLSVTDQSNHTTTFAYDAMDRRISRTDPLLRKESVQYDLNGNRIQFSDRRGKVSTFTYDALNRKIFAGYGKTATTFESVISYSYDAGERLTLLADSNAGAITRVFDGLDRPITETTEQGAIARAYDAVGQLTSKTIAGQPPFSYVYDDAGRMLQISQPGTTVSFAHDDANRRTSLVLPNGVVATYTYDHSSRLTSIAYQSSAGSLGNITYAYDAVGRTIQVGGSLARTGMPAPVSSAVYDAANEVSNWNGTPITYDSNGNMTSDGTNTFTWNARNELAAMNGSFPAYDAMGRRIRNLQGTSFFYDGLNEVQELSSGVLVATRVIGQLDEFFSRSGPSGAFAPLTDAVGSVLALVNAAGQVETQYMFEPFGNTTTTGTANSNVFQYTGRENDTVNLYFYRARYYNPIFGRFISEDPRGLSGNRPNAYVYVNNDPIDYIDLLGLQKKKLRKGQIYPEEVRECAAGPMLRATGNGYKAGIATDKEIGKELAYFAVETAALEVTAGAAELVFTKSTADIVRAHRIMESGDTVQAGRGLLGISLEGMHKQNEIQDELHRAVQQCLSDFGYEVSD